MHRSIVEETISCPFCGEGITVLLDLSVESQSYIEDCEVCCRPMQISYDVAGPDNVSVVVDCAS